jgi:HK97 family phage prohead protease
MRKFQLRNQIGASIRLADAATDGRNIVGRAIVYSSISRDLGGFVERFLPGSVADSVRGGLVCALLNHDTSQPIGDQAAGTLRLIDSAGGLDCEIRMPDASYANDALAVMKQRGGNGTGMSFGFNPIDVNWTREDGRNVAEIRKADLGEVSVLTGMPPAYAATSCAIRSLHQQGEIDWVERYGVDLDALAAVFISLKRGLPLTEIEERTMQQARGLFASARRPLLEAAAERAKQLLVH